MRSVVEIGASVPAFLGKLWKLVNDTDTNNMISWSPGGKTFIIHNQVDFARELLPLYYKHNNMASFIRQLNMYGFHKITSVENGGLRYEKDEIEFSHPCFMKGYSYLLEHIKRKIANPKSLVSSENGDTVVLKPEMMTKVLSDVKQMKGKQENLDAKFSAMKQQNEALWREVAILRQKHIKQQQIVNNLIQFLCNLVQPGRSGNTNSTNVGVKRPYQLMINNAAHNSATDESYPGRTKNIKLDRDALLDDLMEDNLEDGPTIHELAHDDQLNDISQDSMSPSEYDMSILIPRRNTRRVTADSPTDPTSQVQYHVTMEDGEEHDLGVGYSVSQIQGARSPNEDLPASSRIDAPINSSPNNATPSSPTTSKIKTRSGKRPVSKPHLSPSNFHSMNPTADLRLPADIFASDDSVSDAGIPTSEDTNVLSDFNVPIPSTKDTLLGGVNIKLEKPDFTNQTKSKKGGKDENALHLNLADIKTELQDDLDWNNMSLATLSPNNNVSRFGRNRRDNSKTRDELSTIFGTNSNKNDIDDHLDAMQTDLESLRELLRSDSYSLDTNTLMGLFGTEDPFHGLSYNPSADERAKSPNNNNAKKQKGGSNVCGEDENQQLITDYDDVEGNQLISYTGNIPDFEDISIPDLEFDNSQDGCLSPVPSGSTLNTPQVQLNSPSYVIKP